MSDQHTTQTTSAYDDPDLEWEDEAEPVPPARPRRRLLTPVSGALAAVVLVAAGFIAGVQVQKGQQDGGTAGGGSARAGFAARLGGGQGGGATTGGGAAGGSASSNATVGTVANVKGSTLYVTGTDGTTTKIRTNGDSKVTRNADSSPSAVHPGDSVVVQGTRNSSGSVTATSIAATAKGVSAFGGLAGLGNAPSGGASANSGETSGVPQGFAPPQG